MFLSTKILMFSIRPLKNRSKLFPRFFRSKIYPEAFFAYFKSLPEQVQVSWFRDDGMIVGNVKAGDKEFVTQGADADDFIKMVNQSIVTVFNIPEDYVDIVSKTKTYNQSPSEKQLMNDINISKHSFGLLKSEQAFRAV